MWTLPTSGLFNTLVIYWRLLVDWQATSPSHGTTVVGNVKTVRDARVYTCRRIHCNIAYTFINLHDVSTKLAATTKSKNIPQQSIAQCELFVTYCKIKRKSSDYSNSYRNISTTEYSNPLPSRTFCCRVSLTGGLAAMRPVAKLPWSILLSF